MSYWGLIIITLLIITSKSYLFIGLLFLSTCRRTDPLFGKKFLISVLWQNSTNVSLKAGSIWFTKNKSSLGWASYVEEDSIYINNPFIRSIKTI